MSMYFSSILASIGTSIITCLIMEWGAGYKNRQKVYDHDGGSE